MTEEREAELQQLSSSPGRDDLYRVVQTLGTKFAWEVKGRTMIPSILKTLGSHACERRVSYEFRNRDAVEDERDFDPFFLEKHSFSVRFCIQRILTRLQEEKLRAAILGEVKEPHGVYDVTIEVGNPVCTIRVDNVPRLKLEFKSSNSCEIEQQQTYLVGDPAPLVLVRVTFGQVAVLRPEALSGFVDASVRETASKAKRVLTADPETAIVIPGRDCWNCPDRECPYAQRRGRKEGIIKLASEAFEDDLNRLFREIPRISDRVADIVVEELRRNGEVPLQ